jgi:hypothetical protein
VAIAPSRSVSRFAKLLRSTTRVSAKRQSIELKKPAAAGVEITVLCNTCGSRAMSSSMPVSW